VAKRHRIISRGLILITLMAAACSFAIGVSWHPNQPIQETSRASDWLPSTSPSITADQEMGSNPVIKVMDKQDVRGLRKSELFSVSHQDHSSTQSPSLQPDIPQESVTPPVESPREMPGLKSDDPQKSVIPTPEAVRETPVEVTGEGITSGEQLVETFPVPKKFQAKIVKKVTPLEQEKVIALTFDDGPWPDTTFQVLDILKREDIKATFFWVGQYLKADPQIAKRVVADGHAIGNHTWHHWYRPMNQSTAAREIEDTAELIYKTTGVRTPLFRPPGGLLTNGLADYAEEKKYVITLWSVDSVTIAYLRHRS